MANKKYPGGTWVFVCLPIGMQVKNAKKEDYTPLLGYDKEGFVDGILPIYEAKASRMGCRICTAFRSEDLSAEEKTEGILSLCKRKAEEDPE